MLHIKLQFEQLTENEFNNSEIKKRTQSDGLGF